MGWECNQDSPVAFEPLKAGCKMNLTTQERTLRSTSVPCITHTNCGCALYTGKYSTFSGRDRGRLKQIDSFQHEQFFSRKGWKLMNVLRPVLLPDQTAAFCLIYSFLLIMLCCHNQTEISQPASGFSLPRS